MLDRSPSLWHQTLGALLSDYEEAETTQGFWDRRSC